MSKKQLKTNEVFSELTNQSSYFKKDETSNSENIETDGRDERTSERATVRPTDRSTDRFSPQHPKQQKRITRRYSFEAYDDQVKELKRISMEAGIEGENLSISEMIREAIDNFLDERSEE